MARCISPDESGKLYRAVITIDGITSHRGPYTREATAKGQITTEKNWYYNRNREVTGKVQEAVIDWKDVAE